MLQGEERLALLTRRLDEAGFPVGTDRETDTYRVPRGLLAKLTGHAHDCHVARNAVVIEALLDWMEKVECELERRDRERFPRLAECGEGTRA